MRAIAELGDAARRTGGSLAPGAPNPRPLRASPASGAR
jgi:hypothetical protein